MPSCNRRVTATVKVLPIYSSAVRAWQVSMERDLGASLYLAAKKGVQSRSAVATISSIPPSLTRGAAGDSLRIRALFASGADLHAKPVRSCRR